MKYLNNLGTFDSISSVWKAFPYGGKEGDYVVIGEEKVGWNKYTQRWENDPIHFITTEQIADGAITNNKLDKAIQDKLALAETAIQADEVYNKEHIDTEFAKKAYVESELAKLGVGFTDARSITTDEDKNKYIYFSTGEVINQTSNERRLDTFEVQEGQVFLITCRAMANLAATIAFYNDAQIGKASYMPSYSIAGDDSINELVIVVPKGAARLCVSSRRHSIFPYQVRCSSNSVELSKHIDDIIDFTTVTSNALEGKEAYTLLDMQHISVGEPLSPDDTYQKLLINASRKIIGLTSESHSVFCTYCYAATEQDRFLNIDQYIAGYASNPVGGVFLIDSLDELAVGTVISTSNIIAIPSAVNNGATKTVKISVLVPQGKILCVTHSTYITGSYCNVYNTEVDSKRLKDIETELSVLQDEISEEVNKSLNVDGILDEANPLVLIKKTAGYTSIFRKMGVIGGSMSSGQHSANIGADKHDDYPYSTLQFMARLCGSEGFNFSQGGMSARYWPTNTSIGGASDKFQNNPCQMYLIQLGNNDLSIVNPSSSTYDANYSIGSIADVVGNNGVFADTFYGRMGEILHLIRTVQPRAYVFLSTFLNGYGTVPPSYAPDFDYNQAIRNIVEYFRENKAENDTLHYYLVDIYQYGKPYGYYNSGVHADTVRGSHLVATGYLHLAWEYCTYIDWLIKNNMSDFNDVAFIGTDLKYE